MPSFELHQTMATSSSKQSAFNTNATTTPSNDTEIDLFAEAWMLPYMIEIEDSDLTFDGKPLNLWHEENQHVAEQHVCRFQGFAAAHVSNVMWFGNQELCSDIFG